MDMDSTDAILQVNNIEVVYNDVILVLRGRRAMAVLSGMAVLVAIYLAAVWLRLRLLQARPCRRTGRAP